MERRLIEYLPPILRGVREYEVALDIAEQPEYEIAWPEAQRLKDNQFVHTMDAYGVGRWERMLGLVRKASDTLEDRRFRILVQLNVTLPYTMQRLRETLDSLVGSGYALALDHNEYTLTVRVALAARAQMEAVEAVLHRMVPANIVIDLSLMYNKHEQLRPYTHAQLAAYTHEQLRSEVMPGG